MRKSRFTENEMVRAVKQFESGMSSEAICRELGISRILWSNFVGPLSVPEGII
ncbi:MAG: transposase [Bacteroidales bacterium]|nr:transposase [Bacteroidales bacterium]